MLDKLYGLKGKIVQRLEDLVDERALERMNADDLVDAIKDLAEAEYYCSVTEAMDSYGYMPEDMPRDGYDNGMRRGYNPNRDSRGRYTARRGYPRRMGHMDAIENIREELKSATPEEREQLKHELRDMLGM